MNKLTLLSIVFFGSALPVYADELVRLGACENTQQQGNLCQLFEEGTEVGPETSATGISLSQAITLNPGLERYIDDGYAIVHLVLKVDGAPVVPEYGSALERVTPSCQTEPVGCYTVQISENAPLSDVLENIRSIPEFETANGFEAGSLTGNEIVSAGSFTLRL